MKQIRNILPLAILTAVGCFFLLSGTSSAATLNVTTNDVSPAANADGCTLREAIQNINDQAQTNTDCAAGDGSTDTIIIPSGNIVLAADLPMLTRTAIVRGVGMGESIVDGDSTYIAFQSSAQLTISKLTVTAAKDFGVYSANGLDASEIEIDGHGWAATDPNGVIGGLIASSYLASTDLTVNMNNLYVHDFSVSAAQLFPVGAVAGFGHDISLTAENITISNINNPHASPSQVFGMLTGAGLFDNGASPGVVSGTVSNLSVSNIHGEGTAIGFSMALVDQNSQDQNLALRNATIMDITASGTDFLGNSGSFGIASFGGSTVSASNILAVTNTIVSTGTNVQNCSTGNIPMGGTATVNITSTGGNLSDDASCASYFTQSTDQNNVSGLAASLSALADNGGYVPTMALKQGSPAIDAGITVAGLTTDARLAARPQGTAYDSGAYESPYSKPTATPKLAESGENSLVAVVVALFGVGVLMGTLRQSRSYLMR